jgi:hypothetical protein
MNKLLIALLIGLSSAAHADPYRHYGGHHHGGHYDGGYNWVAPLIVGGVVTYALTRPQPVVVQQPIVVQQTLPPAPVGYHYENILDANCNCNRLVLIQN